MSQLVSYKRVREKGEVFTNRREVVSILDMINDGRINCEDRCLEPACGTGNFLVEVLSRKIKHAAELSGTSKKAIKQYVFIAVSTCYGIDIQKDNVETCRSNLLQTVFSFKETRFLSKDAAFVRVLLFILEKNIISCNFLSGEYEDNINYCSETAKMSE